MLNDAELNRLRGLWIDAAVAPVNHRGGRQFPAWDAMIVDPSEATIRAFFHDADTPVEINMSVFDAAATIGIAHVADVLNGVPLPLDDVIDRRWQLRRELARVIAGMDDARLQRLVYLARSIAT